MYDSVPVITIDGPGGSGKGTIAVRLAQHLGWHFLDSGALYRLTAVAVIKHGLPEDDEASIGRMAGKLDIHFEVGGEDARVMLDGNNVAPVLRREDTGILASKVAAFPAVRKALLARQRQFCQAPGLVADGRDMGTVVFPDAGLKIFLTASVEIRAQRRYKQLKQKGENVNLSRLFREIKARDERDRTRSVSPLKAAADAVRIDSTGLSVDEVFVKVCKLI